MAWKIHVWHPTKLAYTRIWPLGQQVLGKWFILALLIQLKTWIQIFWLWALCLFRKITKIYLNILMLCFKIRFAKGYSNITRSTLPLYFFFLNGLLDKLHEHSQKISCLHLFHPVSAEICCSINAMDVVPLLITEPCTTCHEASSQANLPSFAPQKCAPYVTKPQAWQFKNYYEAMVYQNTTTSPKLYNCLVNIPWPPKCLDFLCFFEVKGLVHF